jgi:hypothetical protein
MTRPYVCWAALLVALVALGFAIAAFSLALVAVMH